MIFASATDQVYEAGPSLPIDEPHTHPDAGAISRPHRILLVDDDRRMLSLLRDILEHYPDLTIVGEALDGHEAIAMLATHQPDVIVMDIVMPLLDGVEATRRIKATSPRTVVIGLAGQFVTRTYNAMRTAGAAAFLCKDEIFSLHKTILHTLGRS